MAAHQGMAACERVAVVNLDMRRLLLITVLSAAALTGCEAQGTTATGAPSGTCDPHGFGPLSGCDSDTEDPGQLSGDDSPVGLGVAPDDTECVVSGFGYSGPRGGGGRHYVECRPSTDVWYDQTEYGHGVWKEVDGYPDDGSLNEDDPCPAGGTIYDDGQAREDGAG